MPADAGEPLEESIDEAPHHWQLEGRVIDEGGHPVAGATVVRTGGPGSSSTDADGRFSLGVESLEDIRASHEGYADAVEALPPEGEQLELILRRGSTLLVAVEDDDCRRGRCPVVGATVVATCEEEHPSAPALTNPDGMVTLVVPEESCEITAHLGLRSASRTVAGARSGTQRVSLQLPVSVRLAGVVVDDLGSPVPGVRVGVAPHREGSGVAAGASGIYALARVTTGADGRFAFEGLPSATRHWALEAAERLVITAPREDLVVAVTRKATILLRLVVGGVPEARFKVNGTDIEAPRGRARIEENPIVRSLRISGEFAELTRDVVLEPGKVMDLGEIEAHRGGSLHLVIRDGSGPAAGAEILVRGQVRSYRADKAGMVLVERLSPGRITLAVKAARGIVLPFDVVVKDSEQQELRLTTREGATLTGRTLGPTGEPRRGAVQLVCDGFPINRVADAECRFELHGLLPGRCVQVGADYHFADGASEIVLEAGRRTEADIQFRPDLARHP